MSVRLIKDLENGEIYQDPNNSHCPIAGWNVLLRVNYLNPEKMKSSNRHWKSRDEINILKEKVILKIQYEKAKAKHALTTKKRLGSKSKWPQDIIDLRNELHVKGGNNIKPIWTCREVEGQVGTFDSPTSN